MKDCERCPLEDTNECKHCEEDMMMEKLKIILDEEERRIKNDK